MTKKQFVSLIKTLLPEFPGFVVNDRLMLRAPVQRVLCGINFEGSDFDKNSFYANVCVMPLCVPTTYLYFSFDKPIRHLRGADRWDASSLEEMAELKVALKQQAVPFLSGIESLRDYVEVAKASLSLTNVNTSNNIAFALARIGENKEAIEYFDLLVQQFGKASGFEGKLAERAIVLRTQLLENPSCVLKQLEDWEAESIKNLGLERFVVEA